MKRTVTKGMWTGILVWTLACSTNALEITRYVKPGGTGKGTSWGDACGSINQALAAIKTGGNGTVYVGPGSYTESVYVPDDSRKVSILGGYSENDMEKPDLEKNIVLLSEGKRDFKVLEYATLKIGWRSENILISGINIVNGATGIYMRGTNIRVERCSVSGCEIGIENNLLDNQNHIITGCKVFRCSNYGMQLFNTNILQTSVYNNGLGLSLSGCYVSGCYIFGNVHVAKTNGFGTRDGGGVHMNQTTLMRCFILSNRCDGEGGGIYAGGTGYHSFIFECVIANNTSCDGGGIYVNEQTLIESCTIINNKATRFGGGICIGKSGWNDVSAMTGSILWNNIANGVAQQYGIYANVPFNMTRSAIQGGGLLPETDAENGIIDVSPKNMDPSKPCVALANVAPFSGAATTPEQWKQIGAENFDLTARSACIDKGGDFSEMKITQLGGSVRTLNADRDKDVEFRPRTDGKYDIGAYEYQKPSPDK